MSKTELRKLFNEECLPAIDRGELLEVIESAGVPDPKANEPPGTQSQMVSYWRSTGSSLEKVALIHRYLQPDETLGGSGLPDPKQLLHDGTLYLLEGKSS